MQSEKRPLSGITTAPSTRCLRSIDRDNIKIDIRHLEFFCNSFCGYFQRIRPDVDARPSIACKTDLPHLFLGEIVEPIDYEPFGQRKNKAEITSRRTFGIRQNIHIELTARREILRKCSSRFGPR